MKREANQRREQEHDVCGISKALLIFRIGRAGIIQSAPVVALLYLKGDLSAVGIAMMQQQFAGTQPSRIKVGQIASRTPMQLCILNLMGYKDSVKIEPHARGRNDSQHETDYGFQILTQAGSRVLFVRPWSIMPCSRASCYNW